jgi:hypothetical protein
MAKQTIKLKKYNDIINEYNAGTAITPGMLIAVASDGEVDPNASAGGVCEKMFALEDELQGKTIADAYAIGDPVQCWSATPGEEVFAWLADGEDVAIGDVLVSAGTGKLKASTADSSAVVVEEYPIAVALEAVDMSGSSGVDPTGRIKVRIL